MIQINIDKAKEIAKDKLRADRAPLLAELDIKSQRNIESGADNTEVVAEKQRLRDITKLVDDVADVEVLKEVMNVLEPK